jgi:hypothetical protein
MDLFDAESLTHQQARDVDPLAMEAGPSTGGAENVAVVERYIPAPSPW